MTTLHASPFEAGEEVLLRALEEEASCILYPSLIAKSAFIGKVAAVEDDLQGCKIWLNFREFHAACFFPRSSFRRIGLLEFE